MNARNVGNALNAPDAENSLCLLARDPCAGARRMKAGNARNALTAHCNRLNAFLRFHAFAWHRVFAPTTAGKPHLWS